MSRTKRITYGTSSVAVTGTLADGSEIPTGEVVTVALDGDELQPTIGMDGSFSATFSTSVLTIAGSPYTISFSYVSDGTFASASTTTSLTVTQAAPTVSVADAGGTYNNTKYPATASVAGISGSGSSSLEGVSLSVTYYSGTYTLASQLTGLTPLSSAPSAAGSYTVLASFPGSTDYSSSSQVANFTIAQATPTVTVADAGGTYKNAAFPATDSVKGISGTGGSLLEGVPLVIAYYSGTYPRASQLTGLTPLSAALRPSSSVSYTVLASFAGSTDYGSNSQVANFTIAQATPTVTVADAGGTYKNASFPGTDSIKGVTGSAAFSLESVPLVLTYYGGTYTIASQLTGLTPLSGAPTVAGPYTAVASFAGSTDYMSTAQLADFNIAQVAPTVTVTSEGGTYNGTAFAATDSVKGVSGSAGSTLESTGLVLDYYSGTYSSASQLTGLTPLSAAPSVAGPYTVLASFPGSTDYSSAAQLANFTIAQAMPTVSVTNTGGTYKQLEPFATCATSTVTGISGTAAASLESVTSGKCSSLTYSGTCWRPPPSSRALHPLSDRADPGRPVHRIGQLPREHRLLQRLESDQLRHHPGSANHHLELSRVDRLWHPTGINSA